MAGKNLNEGLLVAYADGELGPEDIALVESAIAADSSVKTRVEKYKQSGELLKDSFDIDNLTPDHIVHRIREIEAAAIKKRQAGLAEDNNQSPSSWWSLPSLGRSLAASFSLRSFTSLGGSFAAGLACAVFVISPGLLTPENDSSQSLPSGDVVQMVMRGSAQNQMPYIRQQNQNISSGGRLIEKQQFSVMYSSPIQGGVEMFEITAEDKSSSDVERRLLTTIKIEAEQLTNLGSFIIDDQDTLRLRIEVSSDATIIRHDVSFKVVEP